MIAPSCDRGTSSIAAAIAHAIEAATSNWALLVRQQRPRSIAERRGLSGCRRKAAPRQLLPAVPGGRVSTSHVTRICGLLDKPVEAF
jgi:hypothetical protein